jgi:hypothetical protein
MFRDDKKVHPEQSEKNLDKLPLPNSKAAGSKLEIPKELKDKNRVTWEKVNVSKTKFEGGVRAVQRSENASTRNLGVRSDVIRLRNSGKSIYYKFTPVSSKAQGGRATLDMSSRKSRSSRSRVSEVILEDPLEESAINSANSYREWLRNAQLALPSKIGT